jgi:hypothetical protein
MTQGATWAGPTVGELRRMLERHPDLADETPLYVLLAGEEEQRWGQPTGGMVAVRQERPVMVLMVKEGPV